MNDSVARTDIAELVFDYLKDQGYAQTVKSFELEAGHLLKRHARPPRNIFSVLSDYKRLRIQERERLQRLSTLRNANNLTRQNALLSSLAGLVFDLHQSFEGNGGASSSMNDRAFAMSTASPSRQFRKPRKAKTPRRIQQPQSQPSSLHQEDLTSIAPASQAILHQHQPQIASTSTLDHVFPPQISSSLDAFPHHASTSNIQVSTTPSSFSANLPGFDDSIPSLDESLSAETARLVHTITGALSQQDPSRLLHNEGDNLSRLVEGIYQNLVPKKRKSIGEDDDDASPSEREDQPNTASSTKDKSASSLARSQPGHKETSTSTQPQNAPISSDSPNTVLKKRRIQPILIQGSVGKSTMEQTASTSTSSNSPRSWQHLFQESKSDQDDIAPANPTLTSSHAPTFGDESMNSLASLASNDSLMGVSDNVDETDMEQVLEQIHS